MTTRHDGNPICGDCDGGPECEYWPDTCPDGGEHEWHVEVDGADAGCWNSDSAEAALDALALAHPDARTIDVFRLDLGIVADEAGLVRV